MKLLVYTHSRLLAEKKLYAGVPLALSAQVCTLALFPLALSAAGSGVKQILGRIMELIFAHSLYETVISSGI